MVQKKQADRTSFYEQVYTIVRLIPKGKVSSYGRIARMLCSPRASRAVGYALRGLRFRQLDADYIEVPWHRVVNQIGLIRVHHKGEEDCLQLELLKAEGVKVGVDLKVDMKRFLWSGISEEEAEELFSEE